MRCLSFVELFFNCITPLKAQKGLFTPSGYITIEIPETGDCLPLHQHFYCCKGPEFLLSITAEQDFNAICLSSYRTACKLRFIQKRCNCKSYQNKQFQTNLNIDDTIWLMFFSQTSAFDRHIQCDWGCAGHWSECSGAERWHLSDQTGEPSVLNVQPAQQAPAYHSHHQPERKRSPAGGLLTGCCWVVTKEKCTFKIHLL